MSFDKVHNRKETILFNDRRKKISLKDTGENRKYLGNNNEKKKIIVYRVDGCLINNSSVRKCDYALYIISSDCLYLIELKGSNCNDAIEQIISTIKIIVKDKNIQPNEIHGRIVLSKTRVPNIRSSKEHSLNKLLKSYRGTFRKDTRQMLEDL